MVKRSDTVWYDHVEAEDRQKTRPAVILRVIADTALLVVGQSDPLSTHVLVHSKKHRKTRRAQLSQDTYFDCSLVIAAPLERIKGRLGTLPSQQFLDIEEKCEASLIEQLQRARERAQVQRTNLLTKLRRHARTHDCTIEEVADQARIARAHLQAIISGEAWWTRDQLLGLAAVLDIEASRLLKADEVL
jgi:mRNA-degrading endonuclease toxin of MazEF toxin-antitoxin module